MFPEVMEREEPASYEPRIGSSTARAKVDLPYSFSHEMTEDATTSATFGSFAFECCGIATVSHYRL